MRLPVWVTYVLVMALVGLGGSQSDRTREPGTFGSYVVEAVLDTLKQACIFDDDRLFFRRLAYVETKDGTDPKTYRPGFDGGIWQIDRELFEKTHQEAARLAHYYQAIRSKLGIDWAAVSWSDLRKPLYSGLAAILYLLTYGPPHSMIPPSVDWQGTLWEQKFRLSGNAAQFIAEVKRLSATCHRDEDIDVLFLIPSTSHMHPDDYNDVKAFVSKTAFDNLDPQGRMRIAMVTYSLDARLDFGLVSTDLSRLQRGIQRATHTGGSREIGRAIRYSMQKVFNTTSPNVEEQKSTAARLVVLVVDGPSNDKVDSVSASARAKSAAGVTVVVVAVGDQVDEEEITLLASSSPCSHIYHVVTFRDLLDLNPVIGSLTCRVPVVLQSGDYSYPCGANILVQVQRAPAGFSLEVSLNTGKVDVYGSYDNPLPSVDVHDLSKTVTPGDPAHYFLQEYRSLTVAITSRLHQSPQCTGNFMVKVANAAPKISQCNGGLPDIEVLVDVSQVKTPGDVASLVDFVNQFVGHFQVGPTKTQIGLVTFSDQAQNQFWMNQYTTVVDLQDAVRRTMGHLPNGAGQSPGSNLVAGLQFIKQFGFSPYRGMRQNSVRTLVLVTEATPSLHQVVEQEAQELHGLGVRIVSVAVGNVNTNLLAILGSSQHVATIADLGTALTEVVQEACREVYVVCVDGVVQRNCSIEDIRRRMLQARYVPDHEAIDNPCSVVVPGMPVSKFPHPRELDRFLLCDSKGQAYVVLCPVGELYSAVFEDCEPSLGTGSPPTTVQHPTTPPTLPTTLSTPLPTAPKAHISTTVSTSPTTLPTSVFPAKPSSTTQPTTPLTASPTSTPMSSTRVPLTTAPPIMGCSNPSNPCTIENLKNGTFHFPCDGNASNYIVCLMPGQGNAVSCPPLQTWNTTRLECIYPCIFLNITQGITNCATENPCVNKSTDGIQSVSTDPSAFITCNGTMGVLGHCSKGQVFSDLLGVCDLP